MLLKLRSNIELLEIKNNLNTINAINSKELKYFNADNNYIETEDAIAMGLKLKPNSHKELDNIPNDDKSQNAASSFSDRTSRKLVNPYEIENKDYNKIIEFVRNENEEYDKRMKKDI
jgi:hypothetical protein